LILRTWRPSEWKRRRRYQPFEGRPGVRSTSIVQAKGGPAVILDTGGTAPGYSNLLSQRQIAQFTRTCRFDRAGLGWSDPSPVEQTSAAIAEDLHLLLHAAGVPPPYVLVGGSFSGFNVRVFAGKYPSEVSGAVLVDSAHEDQYRYEPRATLAPFNRLPKQIRNLLCAGVPLAARVGLVRLLLHGSQPLAGTNHQDSRANRRSPSVALNSKRNRLSLPRSAILRRRVRRRRGPQATWETAH